MKEKGDFHRRDSSISISVDTHSQSLSNNSEGRKNEPYQKNNIHLSSLLLNSFMLILLLVFSLLMISYKIVGNSHNINNHLIIFIACFSVIYLIYLIEVFTSTTFRTLVKKKKISRIDDYIQKLQNAEPNITFFCTSYHYADEIGCEKKRRCKFEKSLSKKKIMTTSSISNFDFSFVKDRSDSISNHYFNYGIIHITLELQICFGDKFTEHRYYQKLEEFEQANKGTDFHYKIEEIQKIHGFKEKITAFNDNYSPFWYSIVWFLTISCLFLMSWPYRVWLQSRIAKSNFSIRKIIFCDQRLL